MYNFGHINRGYFLAKIQVVELVSSKSSSNKNEILEILKVIPDSSIIEIDFNFNLPIDFESFPDDEQGRIYKNCKDIGYWVIKQYHFPTFA